MLLNLYELQDASQKCPELLDQLFQLCHIDVDISRLGSNEYTNETAKEIDKVIAQLLNRGDTFEGLAKLLAIIGITDIWSLTETEMVRMIVENDESIMNAIN
ncbi:MAG: hypothetical protein SFU99_01540 [Saprospiraceae bacterium]|nr:hypothetical protein [Saprospiraceae bacterium]